MQPNNRKELNIKTGEEMNKYVEACIEIEKMLDNRGFDNNDKAIIKMQMALQHEIVYSFDFVSSYVFFKNMMVDAMEQSNKEDNTG